MVKEMQIGGYRFEASSLDKVMYPDIGKTKWDLLEYYERVAPFMLPHLEGRPISMQRFPNGIEESGFYQKQAPDYFPEWVRRVPIEVEEEGETQLQVVVDKEATLVYLAEQGTTTFHTWLSCEDDICRPDTLIFDLDPSGGAYSRVQEAAEAVRTILVDLDLIPFVKTTGSKGLHVVCPILPEADFDEVREFARDLAEVLEHRYPQKYTTQIRKEKREGKLFLDYLRNAYAQTAVAPYSLRPKPGAPIAVPLDWEEAMRSDIHSQTYTIENIFRRLGQKQDPWEDMREQARSLDEPISKLAELKQE